MPSAYIGRQSIPFEAGASLSALVSGHGVSMPCGGAGTCLACRVKVSGALSPPCEKEIAALGTEALASGWRLACMARAFGDVTILLDTAEKIITDGLPDAAPSNPMFSKYGAAVDIGTTTLALGIYDIHGLLGTATVRNPQAVFGADVITRLGKAAEGDAPAIALSVRKGIFSLLEELAAGHKIPIREIDRLVVTGNTAMLYLLTGQDPAPLTHAPFEARRLFGEILPAPDLFPALPDAEIYIPPCVSAFVGADILCAVLASGMCRCEKTALLMDIGTNGELALWHDGTLLCCSTAAGPAFEGAGIQMGSFGVAGAIESAVFEDGALHCRVIGDIPAKTICGSGIADVTAALLKCGAVDENGFMEEDGHALSASMAERAGDTAVRLSDDVFFTARDVRMVQLAKGSIRAGLETLPQIAGIKTGDIEKLYIAGGFGSYLNLTSAAEIGLIPKALVKRAQVIGNGALAGAAMSLCDKSRVRELARLAKLARTAALDANPVFTANYMKWMGFDCEA